MGLSPRSANVPTRSLPWREGPLERHCVGAHRGPAVAGVDWDDWAAVSEGPIGDEERKLASELAPPGSRRTP